MLENKGGLMQTFNLNQIKDNELLETFSSIVKNEREATALLILHLSEIDKRGLYAKEGFSSLFSYCVEKFRFSEEAAYRRIQAARLSRKFPEILGLLEEGKINLTWKRYDPKASSSHLRQRRFVA